MPTSTDEVLKYLQAAAKALKQGDKPLYDAFMSRANEVSSPVATQPCHGRRLV
jgi:hypothetical protein